MDDPWRPGLIGWVWMTCLLGLLGAFPAHALAQVEPRSPDPGFLIEPGRAGEFFVGITPWEVTGIVEHRPLSMVDRFLEGNFTPAVELYLEGNGGEMGIVAYLGTLQCDRFWEWYFPRLIIQDSRFRTSDGIGVGSTMAEARDLGWVTADGQPGDRAVDPGVDHFARIQFWFDNQEKCERCPPPEEDNRIIGIILMDPYPGLRDRRCEELGERYR